MRGRASRALIEYYRPFYDLKKYNIELLGRSAAIIQTYILKFIKHYDINKKTIRRPKKRAIQQNNFLYI